MTPTCTCSPSILDPLCPVEPHRQVQRAGMQMTPAQVDEIDAALAKLGGSVADWIRASQAIDAQVAARVRETRLVTAMGDVRQGAMVASTPFGVKEVRPRQAIDAETVTLPTDGSEVTATFTTAAPALRGMFEPSHGSLAHVIRTRQPDQVAVTISFIAEYPNGSRAPLLPGEPETFDGQPYGDMPNHPLEQMQRNGGKLPVPIIEFPRAEGEPEDTCE